MNRTMLKPEYASDYMVVQAGLVYLIYLLLRLGQWIERMTEPTITINGHALTEAQAITVRVAVTDFHATTSAGTVYAEAVGPISDTYRARLTEILKLMFGKQ
jgi:hypothetical protein